MRDWERRVNALSMLVVMIALKFKRFTHVDHFDRAPACSTTHNTIDDEDQAIALRHAHRQAYNRTSHHTHGTNVHEWNRMTHQR